MDSLTVLGFFFFVVFVLIWIYSHIKRKTKREYGVKSVTLRGEQVKSIAEKRIADYFEKNNIR